MALDLEAATYGKTKDEDDEDDATALLRKDAEKKKQMMLDAKDYKPAIEGSKVVLVQVHVNNIYTVDLLDGTFKTDLDMELLWRAPEEERLSKSLGAAEDPEKEVWQPNIELCNLVEGERSGEVEAMEMKDLGGETFQSRESLFLATARSNMPIREFPFDSHCLDLIFRSEDQPKGEMEFKAIEESIPFDPEAVHLPEYHVEEIKIETGTFIYAHVVATEGLDDATYSEANVKIYLKRRPQYYFAKLIDPVHLLGIISFAGPLQPPHELNNRAAILSGLVLAAIGLMYTGAAYLPKTSTLSYIDRLMQYLLVVLTLMLVETLIAYLMDLHGHTQAALILDGVLMGFVGLWLLVSSVWWYCLKHNGYRHITPASNP